MSQSDEFERQLELEKQERQLKEAEALQTSDPYTYVDPDGTTFEWNHEKQAWFPKIDDNFLAAYYQANYGSGTTEQSESSSNPESSKESSSQRPKKPGEKRPAPNEAAPAPGWFDVSDEHNTNVYVSNLPNDITDDEFTEMMSKCGIIMKDVQTGKLKIKLYRDPSGKLKGDGRCCYIKVESVELALKILDGSQLRGKEIRVERAKFQLKGQYDPLKKPKKMKSKEKKKVKEIQEKLLDWRPDRPFGTRLRCERTVIITNMFDPEEFRKNPENILDYKCDLQEECARFGQVKKIIVYDRNPNGVATITFKEAEEADACIQTMNGRWFGGRQLTAHSWDGKSKYYVVESETEHKERLQEWEEFLKEEQKEEAEAT